MGAKDNMPTLYRNVIDGLPTQFAVETFLWASDKFQNDRMAYRAEQFAREADSLMTAFDILVDVRQMATIKTGGVLLSEDQASDLARFIQVRHANWELGGNVKTAPPETITEAG